MFEFCPHCGQSAGPEQVPGQAVVCKHCGQQIGVVPLPTKPLVRDQTEELIRRGVAARCPVCQQVVELKGQGTARAFVPHFAAQGQRKMCAHSGKPVASDSPSVSARRGLSPPRPAHVQPAHGRGSSSDRRDQPGSAPPASAAKDLSAFMTREVVRVALCRKDAPPQIEELTLEYLDRSDRVRLQIEALREILGPGFRMKDYPASLRSPHLALWGHATACVIAARHAQGGYQQLSDSEVAKVVEDFQQHGPLFFT
jgi:hypothetical protein